MNNYSFLLTTTTGPSGTLLTDKDGGEDEGEISPTQRIVVLCMLSVFSVIGTIGNALAIYVFASLKQKLTSTVFILTLAGTDFLTCLITIPFTMYMEYVNHYAITDAACKVFSFLSTTTVPFSALVMVAIAVDRYICICHPFNHWMTIQRARIIIAFLLVFIFFVGGVICMHHSIYRPVTVDANLTAEAFLADASGPVPDPSTMAKVTANNNSFYNAVHLNESGSSDVDYNSNNYNYNSNKYDSNRNNNNVNGSGNNSNSNSSSAGSAIRPLSIKNREGVMDNHVCDIMFTNFMKIFQTIYISIFAVSCIIVLILYSLIYRYVISQRKKKLRIKSAQCCLLWNATSVETPHEAVEMTQDIELSNVNGDRYNARHNSTDDTNEGHNNVSARKCSISKARIERMRVANIKTAFTLFIVTLVFIVVFLPAWLMALEVLSMHIIIFYMHFIYNVSNPFIYAFLNQNFKTELRRIIRCGKH